MGTVQEAEGRLAEVLGRTEGSGKASWRKRWQRVDLILAGGWPQNGNDNVPKLPWWARMKQLGTGSSRGQRPTLPILSLRNIWLLQGLS